jgi:hypothetical protein
MTAGSPPSGTEVPISALVDRRYRVRREIARGGMGIVYEAEHTVLGDVVALKCLNSRAREVFGIEERLMREARALARARHPHVVAVRDAGICPSYGPYVALDRLEGRPLDGLLTAKTRLQVPTVVHLALAVGDALTHAHTRGVIHRDLKPANVFVAKAPEGERACLIDFGISHLLGEDVAQGPKLTRAGEVLGTPEYMAPEILIDGLPPRPESDVYALAAMLYECLTGDVPHAGPAMKIMSALLVDKPFKPIAASRGDVPPAIEAALKRGLSRDPAERPKTPSDLARLIHAAVGGPVEPLALLESDGPADQGGATRRQFDRAAYVAPVRVQAEKATADGRTEDISEGGLLVVGALGPIENQEVEVRLPLPTSGRVAQVRARSKWVRTRRGANALGLEFIDLPADARADIARYVSLMSESRGRTDAGRKSSPPGAAGR